MKIYVVTEGEYSDYHIEGVFLTKEAADKYVKLHYPDVKYAYPNVEEYDTIDELYSNGEYVIECRAEFSNVLGTLTKWGGAYCTSNVYPVSQAPDEHTEIETWNNITIFYFYVSENSKALRDKELLRKIAQDRYAVYKARKEGIV